MSRDESSFEELFQTNDQEENVEKTNKNLHDIVQWLRDEGGDLCMPILTDHTVSTENINSSNEEAAASSNASSEKTAKWPLNERFQSLPDATTAERENVTRSNDLRDFEHREPSLPPFKNETTTTTTTSTPATSNKRHPQNDFQSTLLCPEEANTSATKARDGSIRADKAQEIPWDDIEGK